MNLETKLPRHPMAPAWLLKREGLTPRQWKARKRREAKELEMALGVYRMGCAYTPASTSFVGEIARNIATIRQELSVKSWGR
jgi:hypothetical protein